MKIQFLVVFDGFDFRVKDDFLFRIEVFKERKRREIRKVNKNINEVSRKILKISQQ